MKILILGCYYSANLGDGVICECVADQIRRTIPGAEIIIADLWDRTGFEERNKYTQSTRLSERQMISGWIRGKLRRFVTKYAKWDKQYKGMNNLFQESKEHLEQICKIECDLIVFAGGQMFMDPYALRDQFVVQRAAEQGRPVIFNACGAGPTYSKRLRGCLADALNSKNVLAISSRDDVQQINRYYTYLDKRTEETFDPALFCANYYGIGKDKASDVVGLGIMWAAHIPPHVLCHFWHKVILELERRQIPWRIFVNGDNTDVMFARYVIDTMPGIRKTFEACSVPIPERPEELVQTISQFKSIISFRLHSHIIATSLDIPSVAVVWDDKVRIFFAKIGHPERCCTIKDRPGTILKKLEAAQREGYNRDLIETQKRYSEEWLINAIRKTGLV